MNIQFKFFSAHNKAVLVATHITKLTHFILYQYNIVCTYSIKAQINNKISTMGKKPRYLLYYFSQLVIMNEMYFDES